MSTVNVSVLRRRRGTVKASLTRLSTKVSELEEKEPDPSIPTQAQQLLKHLETLDGQFKTHHLAIVDSIEEESQLTTEQEALDKHDDEVYELNLKLQALMVPSIPRLPSVPSTTADSLSTPKCTVLEWRSAQLQAQLVTIHEKIGGLKDDGSDIHLLHLYQEHLSDLKRELSDLRKEILAVTADTSDILMSSTNKQEETLFDMSVKVKKLMFLNQSDHLPSDSTATKAAVTKPRTVKLPKIDVLTFDGELLHWQTFWEQFDISIHKRSDISNTEKLVYLCHSLKDGAAKNIIEGLSHSGDQYNEAIESLQARYDRPRIIHQAHVRKIYEVPSLKDGSGRELRRFHDTVQQHLRALRAMDEDLTGSFITALLELKLDKETMFEWQKTSQDTKGIPHYDDLLKFLNLRAQASETCSSESKKHQLPKKPMP